MKKFSLERAFFKPIRNNWKGALFMLIPFGLVYLGFISTGKASTIGFVTLMWSLINFVSYCKTLELKNSTKKSKENSKENTDNSKENTDNK